jgi:hypothetical protein
VNRIRSLVQNEIRMRGIHKCKVHTKQWKSPHPACFE